MSAPPASLPAPRAWNTARASRDALSPPPTSRKHGPPWPKPWRRWPRSSIRLRWRRAPRRWREPSSLREARQRGSVLRDGVARRVQLHGQERVVAVDPHEVDDGGAPEALLGAGKGDV